jgi:hypothetical protein
MKKINYLLFALGLTLVNIANAADLGYLISLPQDIPPNTQQFISMDKVPSNKPHETDYRVQCELGVKEYPFALQMGVEMMGGSVREAVLNGVVYPRNGGVFNLTQAINTVEFYILFGYDAKLGEIVIYNHDAHQSLHVGACIAMPWQP